MNFSIPPENPACPICSHRNLRKFSADASDVEPKSASIHIVECKSCGFAWQYPLQRNQQESIAFFQRAYKGALNAQTSYFRPEYKRETVQFQVEFLTRIRRQPGRLLDFGAGAGFFAQAAAAKGWKVTAVDPALSMDNVQHENAIELIRGTFDDIPEGRSYDAVTMWDVIEHVADPYATAVAAKNLLLKDGCLIVEAPNYRSAERIRQDQHWWGYQQDHKWYFSPDSMEKLLRHVGFTRFAFADRQLRPQWNDSADYPGPSRRRLLRNILRRPQRATKHIREYLRLLSAKSWPCSGIEIFTVAAHVT